MGRATFAGKFVIKTKLMTEVTVLNISVIISHMKLKKDMSERKDLHITVEQ
jgi:hypothetical protein